VRLSNQEDAWRWKFNESGCFTVNLSYKKLEGLVLREVVWTNEERGVFEKLWKCLAPSKVVAFAWKAIINRVPTKVNLALRNVLGSDVPSLCGLCNRGEESVFHLFLHCQVANSIWLKLMRCRDSFISPPNLFVH
jgi:hypothetical protein